MVWSTTCTRTFSAAVNDAVETPEQNIRGPLLLLIGSMPCWKCSEIVRVGALAGQADTEAWLDDAEPPRWLPFGDPGAVERVTALSPDIEAAVRVHLPTYHPAFSQTAEMGYWMNHCAACQASTGDFYAHGADGPFFAWPRAGRDGITIVELGQGELRAEPPYIIPPEFNLPPRKMRQGNADPAAEAMKRKK